MAPSWHPSDMARVTRCGGCGPVCTDLPLVSGAPASGGDGQRTRGVHPNPIPPESDPRGSWAAAQAIPPAWPRTKTVAAAGFFARALIAGWLRSLVAWRCRVRALLAFVGCVRPGRVSLNCWRLSRRMGLCTSETCSLPGRADTGTTSARLSLCDPFAGAFRLPGRPAEQEQPDDQPIAAESRRRG